MVIMMDFFAAPQQQKEKLTPWTKPLGGKASSYVALKEDTEIWSVSQDLDELQLGLCKSEMQCLHQLC